MYLVISEKPSVAQSIAKVLGAYKREDGYISGRDCIVSWCLGHLAEYAMPEAYDEKYRRWNLEDLPIIPESWKLEVAGEKSKQFQILKKLMNNSLATVDYVVNACDAGREGELIFKRVYDLSGSRLPVKRLWISSMEDASIRKGFRQLKSGEEYKNLADASVCRAQADWLVGMNASRAYTKTYDYRMTVGRVQTPTLAMLVKRGEEIERFQKKQYFLAHVKKDGLDAVTAHLDSKAEAGRIAAACNGADAQVTGVKREAKSVPPPKLYDLTTLQREANRLFGYTAKQTLGYAQSLYEKKLLTYPRTDSQYLTDDMAETAGQMIGIARGMLPFVPETSFAPDTGRVLDSKKVSDHHAIIPTAEAGKADLDSLPKAERDILFLAANRLLCAAAPKYSYLSIRAEITCCGYHFSATGKTVMDAGWKQYEDALKKYLRADEDTDPGGAGGNLDNDQGNIGESPAFPELKEGQVIRSVESAVTGHFTQPPKPYTEDSLLAAMERAGCPEMEDGVERKGLGTPATRAGIIEKLVASKYAMRKKKQIIATEAGSKMIALMPEYLKSARMTADWENRLLMMERGETTPEAFMADIRSLVGQIVFDCRAVSPEERQKFAGQDSRDREIGKCPICKSPVYEGKGNFYCSNRECRFAFWKESRYLSSMKKNIDRKMAAELLSSGKTHAKDFYSARSGKNFEADLCMDVTTDGKASFCMEFPKRPSGKKKQ